MFSELPFIVAYSKFKLEQFSLDIEVSTQTFKLQITLRIFFIKLSKGSHIF